MSVNEKMTLLADAVRAKSGTTGPLSIDGMTTAVNSITVGIDTSDATAVASDIATGKTAYVKGELVTGTGVEPVYYKCLDSNLVSPAYAKSLADWYTISSNSGVGWYAFRLGEAHSYWEAKSIYADGEYPPAQLKIQFNEKKRVDGYRIKFYNNGSLYYPTSRINLYGVTSTSKLDLLDSLSGEDYMGDNEIRREFSSVKYSAYVLEFTDDLLPGSGQWNVSEFALYSAESPYWAGYKAYKDGDDYRFEIALTDRLVFTGDTPPSPGKCYSADGFVEVNLSGSPWGSDTTATASDISDGKTAYIMGERVAGTMPDSEITVEDNIVTVTAGRVVNDTPVTVPEAEPPTLTENIVTIKKGYVTEATEVIVPEMTITNDGKNITVPVGYNKTERTFVVGGDGIDTSDATATASDISAGVTAYVKGELVTGTMKDVTAVIDGATVTIPAGRIREEQTLTVQKGSVNLDSGRIFVAEGYVEEQTLTVPAGNVVVDETANKVIVSEGYVKPQEIPLPGGSSGVDVTLGMVNDDLDFQPVRFEGTDAVPEGDVIPVSAYYSWNNNAITLSDVPVISGMQYYYIEFDLAPYASAVNGKVKFFCSDLPDGFSLDGSVIKGKTDGYGIFASSVTVSSKGASDKVLNIHFNIEEVRIPGNPIFYAPLDSTSATAVTGQTLSYIGSPVVETLGNTLCMKFEAGQGIKTNELLGISGGEPRTISFWAAPTESVPDYSTAIQFGQRGQNSKDIALGPRQYSGMIKLMFGGWNNDASYTSSAICDGYLHHCAAVYTGSELKLYVDGNLGGGSVSGLDTTDTALSIAYSSDASEYAFSGHIAAVRIYDRALIDEEISVLSKEIPMILTQAIPTTFTSNTSIDGYTINQSHGAGSYPQAWCVFNQNTTTGDYAWWTGNIGVSQDNPAWFSIEVPEAFIPKAFRVMNEISSPQNFKDAVFQGSNDGEVWDDLYSITDSPNTTGYIKLYEFDCNTAYKHFRMLFTASHASGVSVQAFQIFK